MAAAGRWVWARRQHDLIGTAPVGIAQSGVVFGSRDTGIASAERFYGGGLERKRYLLDLEADRLVLSPPAIASLFPTPMASSVTAASANSHG